MRGLRATLLAGAVLTCTLAAPLAHAAETPAASRFDSRIRYVTYNPADVVAVDTAEGIVTHIALEEGETVMTFALGDAEAWAVKDRDNHLFIKPKADHADTNLIVISDRRTYNFWLAYHRTPAPAKGPAQARSGRETAAIYQLSFHYPDSGAKVKAAAAAKAAVEQAFVMPPEKAQTNYSMSGDQSIAPLNVWDDGKFTYFKFQANRDLPAIYMVDADGQESLVNRTGAGVASDVVVAQKVNDRWRLRLGRQVLAIKNNDMIADNDRPIRTAPRYEDPNRFTSTASPAVQRISKGVE